MKNTFHLLENGVTKLSLDNDINGALSAELNTRIDQQIH